MTMCDFPFVWQDYVDAGILRPVQPTTSSGWMRYHVGREFLPASTNLFTDPQVVNDLGGSYWAAAPADCTITPNTTVPISFGAEGPTKCAKVVFAYDSSARSWDSATMAVTAGQTYTLQSQIYAPVVAASATIAISAVVMNLAAEVRTVALGTVSVANGVAVRYSNSVVIAGSGETHIKFRYTFNGASSTVYVSGHKNANLTYLDPYHDGTMDDCDWTGTAHASTSTRSASSLVYTTGIPSGLSAAATIAARIRAYWTSTDPTQRTVCHITGAGGKGIYLGRVNITVSRWYGESAGAGTKGITSDGNESFAVNTQHVLVVRTTAASLLDLNHDGTNAGQVANNQSPETQTTITVGNHATTGASSVCGLVGPLIVSPSYKPSSWVAAIQANSGGMYSSLTGIISNYMAVGDFVAPLNGDSTAYVKVR